jgi:hypothetical protein
MTEPHNKSELVFGHRKGSGSKDLLNPIDLGSRPVKKYPHLFGRRGFRIKVPAQLSNDITEDFGRIMGLGDQAAGHIEQQPLHDGGPDKKVVQDLIGVGQVPSLRSNSKTRQLYRAFVEHGNQFRANGEAE